jgi:hypothetical protein
VRGLLLTGEIRLPLGGDGPHLADGIEVGLVFGVRNETPGIPWLRHVLAEVRKTAKKELWEQETIGSEIKDFRIDLHRFPFLEKHDLPHDNKYCGPVPW